MCKTIVVHGPGLARIQQAHAARRFNVPGLYKVLVSIGNSKDIFGGKPQIFCELNNTSRTKEEFEEGGFSVINSQTQGGSILEVERRLKCLDPAISELVVVGLEFSLLPIVERIAAHTRVFWLGVGSPDNSKRGGLSNPLTSSRLMERGITFLDLCMFARQIIKEDSRPEHHAAVTANFSRVVVVLRYPAEDDKKYLRQELKSLGRRLSGKFEVKKTDIDEQYKVEARLTGPASEHDELVRSLQAWRRHLPALSVQAMA